MTTIQIEFYQVIMILIIFFGGVAGAGAVLLNLYDKRLDERFAAQEVLRKTATDHWDRNFVALKDAAKEETGKWQAIERELLTLKADLPLNYVRRDDYVRGQSVIESKLDGLASRLPIRTQGNPHA